MDIRTARLRIWLVVRMLFTKVSNYNKIQHVTMEPHFQKRALAQMSAN